jgi:hypothetical protein
LVVRLLGDDVQYQKVLTDAAEDAEQAASKIEGVTDRIGRAFGGLAVAAPIFAIGKQAVGAFAATETIEARLRSALAGNQRDVEATFNRYKQFAEGIQEVSTAEGAAVLNTLRLAEQFKLTGAAAEKATRDAYAFAAFGDVSADAALRVTQAMAKGDTEAAMRFSKLIPALRGISDEAAFTAEYARLVAGGMASAEAETKTFAGTMTRMKVAADNMLEPFGEIIADALKPLIDGLRMAAKWVGNLSDESKRWITVGAFAVSALGVTAFLSSVKAILFGLLNPIVLVTAAVGTLGYWIVTHTKTGKAALDWFGRQWARLVEHVRPALRGIKDAIAAGNLKLAFDIAWVQIQISFQEGVRPLREAWIGFLTFFKQAWAESVAFVRTQWLGATTSIAEMLISSGLFGGDVDEVLKTLDEDSERAANRIKADRQAAMDAIDAEAAKRMQGLDAQLRDLKTRRDELTEQARAENIFAQRAGGRIVEAGRNAGRQFNRALVDEIKRFQAVEYGGAEAVSRIAEFLEMGGLDVSRSGGRAEAERPPLPRAGAAEPEVEMGDGFEAAMNRSNRSLDDIDSGVNELVDLARQQLRKPSGLTVSVAGLT